MKTRLPNVAYLQQENYFAKALKARKMLAATALVGACTLIRCCNSAEGLPEMKSSSEDYKFSYEEACWNWNPMYGFSENRMRLEKDSITYDFIDKSGETLLSFLDEKKPNLESDRLEKIIITTPDSRHSYVSSDAGQETLDGKHTQNVFNAMNPVYNRMRSYLREELRKKTKAEYSSMEKMIAETRDAAKK